MKSKLIATYQFIKRLSTSGRLVRNYSQNIDLLEDRVGLCADLSEFTVSQVAAAECVLLHGSLRYLRCVTCGQRSNWDEYEAITMSGTLPTCPHCRRKSSRGRTLAPGVLRPDIVLYGESDPRSTLISHLIRYDLHLDVDLLLILGTSLATYGVRKLVKDFRRTVQKCNGIIVYVNRTEPEGALRGLIDYWVKWDCDEWVRDLTRRPEFRAGMDNSYQEGKPTGKRRASILEQVPKRVKAFQVRSDSSSQYQNMGSMWSLAAGTQDDPIDLTDDRD